MVTGPAVPLHRSSLALAFLAPLLGGCVQLVALGQPVIGVSDEPQPTTSTAAGVCDDSVAIGAQAYCDLSCAIDPTDGASTCGERVVVDGTSARLDVSGLAELEVVVNACARAESGWSLEDEDGATLAARGTSLEVRSSAGQVLHRAADFLPADECEERTVILQDRRLELGESERRLCDAGLLHLPARGAQARWHLRWSPAVRSIELCLRNARPARAT